MLRDESMIDFLHRTRAAMQTTTHEVEAFMLRKQQEPKRASGTARVFGAGTAAYAWKRYQAMMMSMGYKRRQLRKREFVSGFESGRGRG